ncbi:MAG: hypothetical protein M1818_003409 [Claussenomyces sp. TS43310]|nr:MAG: hypothetical protein M1818_003409 [Claussenomyces sp. TS43310]
MQVHVQKAASLRRDPASSDPSTLNVRRVSSFDVTQHQPCSPNLDAQQSYDNDKIRPQRQPRKPSPGLAARLRALGFGGHNSRKQAIEALDSIGRIPADQIQQLELLARTNSTKSIERRGRAWSGVSSKLPPQIIGDTVSGFRLDHGGANDEPNIFEGDTRVLEVRTRRNATSDATEDPDMVAYDDFLDMDPQKYRLPDHFNGNATKTIPDTRRAHMERSEEPLPPPPISKDPPSEVTTPNDLGSESYFNPFGLQRTGSIYTLSRVSFSNQLAQLTSLQLPDADSLSSKVSAIPTAQAATKALMSAADQIRSWISKASDVLGGLDADDDVEWAAAGGREGLEDVDNAIVRFEELVKVFVNAIEELQSRADISSVASEELTAVVTQVETILDAWERVRGTLTGVKSQVEIAMEWEELWNVVLGDIGNEMDILSRLVFEMEERRHRSLIEETTGVDIGDLETIVEETPPSKARSTATNRFSVSVGFPMSPNSPNTPAMAQDDSSLLALFARMQPLRASLDFLPMRLSTFHARAEESFPTACAELESRRAGLEDSWKDLERDAESLRRELGEDRWVLVFRGAGRQALKMYESVERSIIKLKESIDTESHLGNPSIMGKKIESYETKKQHYGPAIERVLAIIEKGVHDRLTVNGEIVRLHTDMQKKWEDMKARMKDLDCLLEEVHADRKNQQLRDSISSLVSNDRSTVASLTDTPGSSPASSVIMSGLETSTPARNGKMRSRMSYLPRPETKRISTSPASSSGLSNLPRKEATSRLPSLGADASSSPTARGGSATPTGNRLPRPSPSSDGKPRWNSNFKSKDDPLGMTFNALQLSTPSPHTRPTVPSACSRRSMPASASFKDSKIPLRSSLTSDTFSSPASETTPSKARNASSHPSFRDRVPSFGNDPQQMMSSTGDRSLKPRKSVSNLGASRRISLQPTDLRSSSPSVHASLSSRPASSLASSRRTSLLPQLQPRGRQCSGVTGRESPQAIAGAASALKRGSSQVSTDSKGKEKPRWR